MTVGAVVPAGVTTATLMVWATEVMPAAKYAFWYEGKPWSGAPERGIKEGDLRDGGSLAERASHVAYWHQWPDEYDFLIQKWDEFLSA